MRADGDRRRLRGVQRHALGRPGVGLDRRRPGGAHGRRHDGDADLPWYSPLDFGVSLNGFRNSRAGAFATHQLVRVLEKARIAPKGTLQMHSVLRLAQTSLVEAGKLDIFTPMYFWVARKPLK